MKLFRRLTAVIVVAWILSVFVAGPMVMAKESKGSVKRTTVKISEKPDVDLFNTLDPSWRLRCRTG